MAMLRKEWLLAMRCLHEMLQPCIFLLILVTLFPIAVSTDKAFLQKIAPGVIWIAVMLSILMASERLYKSDYEDGSLEQCYLSGHSLLLMVFGKWLVQWVIMVVPVCLVLPLLGLLYGLSLKVAGCIALTILIGSPSLLLLAMLGSAVTLSIARGGLLLILVIVPFYLPVLIFSLSVIDAYTLGNGFIGQLLILTALLVLTLTIIPFTIIAAIKVSLSES